MAAPSLGFEITIFGREGSKHSFQYSLLHCLSELNKSLGQVVLDMKLVDQLGTLPAVESMCSELRTDPSSSKWV